MANTTTKPIEWHIYNELVKAVKSAGVTNIYLENRSKKMDGVSEFVVVSLPGVIQNMFAGNDDFVKLASGIFYVGEKAKSDNTPNILAQTNLVQSIKNIFPINDAHIVATKPIVRFAGDDGSSFQMTEIIFNIRTK